MYKNEPVIVIRQWSTLMRGAKTHQGRNYLRYTLLQLIEPRNLICLEITRISRSKWQLTHVTTEDNSYYLGDENIILKADWYDTKMLLNTKPIEFTNDLGMTFTEYRVKPEWDL